MHISFILGSSRNDGNTRKVIESLRPELDFKLITLADKQIAPYSYNHLYPSGDDFMPLMKQMVPETDLFVLATPVYWFSMSGQLKIFMDRFTDLLKINKPLGRQLRGKRLSMLSCSAHNDRPEHFEEPFQLSADYLGMHYIPGNHFWIEGAVKSNKPKWTKQLTGIQE